MGIDRSSSSCSQGLKWTLALSAIGFVGGGIAGLAVALARTSGISAAGARDGGLHRACSRARRC